MLIPKFKILLGIARHTPTLNMIKPLINIVKNPSPHEESHDISPIDDIS